MLIGPHAPLVLERGLRATHVQHVYDFYKPEMASEYPTVDGKLSIQCYLSSLDKCYQLYRHKSSQLKSGKNVNLDSFDAVLFHSPFCKLVQKSFARLVLNDFVNTPKEERSSRFPDLVNQFLYLIILHSYSALK
jgi:hydroxymethylglutaryl-CoA synthase